MNLRQERLLSRRSQLGRERFKCWNAWCSWHRQRHERGRYRCVALSLFTDPAVHHVRVQAMRQGHTTDAGPRLGTQGKYLCLELLAVFTPAWAVLIQRLFHRLHDPPSWGRCPLQATSSRWDRQPHTLLFPSSCHGVLAVNDCAPLALAAWWPSSIIDCLRCAVPRKGRAIPLGNLSGVHHEQRPHY